MLRDIITEVGEERDMIGKEADWEGGCKGLFR